jgi:hypothetical protein
MDKTEWMEDSMLIKRIYIAVALTGAIAPIAAAQQTTKIQKQFPGPLQSLKEKIRELQKTRTYYVNDITKAQQDIPLLEEEYPKVKLAADEARKKMRQHTKKRSMLNYKDWYRVFVEDPEYEKLWAAWKPLMEKESQVKVDLEWHRRWLPRDLKRLEKFDRETTNTDIEWLLKNKTSKNPLVKQLVNLRNADITALKQGYALKPRDITKQETLIRYNRGIDPMSRISIECGGTKHDVSVDFFEQNKLGAPLHVTQ